MMRLCIRKLDPPQVQYTRAGYFRAEYFDGYHHIGVFATTQMNYDDPLATFSTLREARDYVQDACLADGWEDKETAFKAAWNCQDWCE